MKALADIYTSNSCGDYKVINYVNCECVEVQFIDTGFITKTQAGNVRSGAVKDKLAPSVFGVGFFGVGKYKGKIRGKVTKVYNSWSSMMQRCYDEKLHARYPTYIGCTVAKEWHNFQVFAMWFDENYIDGYDLDKDVKVKGNKIYSPVTCVFVTHSVNMIESCARHYEFINPKGEAVNIYNMAQFCRNNNLNNSAMAAVHSGKRAHHKQWRKS